MPTYQYACIECGNQLEAVQSFSDPALTECPECQGKLRKVFSAVGVVFKGSGFYRTDSRSGTPAAKGTEKGDKGADKTAAKAESSTSGSSSDSSSSGNGSSTSASNGKSSNGSSGGSSGGSTSTSSTSSAAAK